MAAPFRARTKGGKAPVFADGSTLAEAARRAALASVPAAAARAAADEIVRLSDGVEQASSRLAHFRAALRAAGAPPAAVDAAKRAEITTAANQRRFDRFGAAGGPAQTGLAPPAAWSFEAVGARLARADPSDPSTATKGDVLDLMVALAARPAELARLAFEADGRVRGFAKARGAPARPYAGMLERGRAAALLAWVQAAIARRLLPDPGTPGSKPYRALLAPHGLRPKDLRALGAEYAARAAGAQTDAMRAEVRRLALRHKAARTPAQYYSIVRNGAAPEGPAERKGRPPRRRPRVGPPRPRPGQAGRAPSGRAPRSATEPKRQRPPRRPGAPARPARGPGPKKRSRSAQGAGRFAG